MHELVTAVGNPNRDKLRTCVNLGPPRRIPQDYIKHEITLLWERSVRKSEGGQIIPDYHIFQRNFKKVVGSARVKVVCQRSLMMSRSRSVSPQMGITNEKHGLSIYKEIDFRALKHGSSMMPLVFEGLQFPRCTFPRTLQEPYKIGLRIISLKRVRLEHLSTNSLSPSFQGCYKRC